MIFVLDTDTLIYFLKGHPSVVEQIANTPLHLLATTVINQSELLFGAYNSQKKSYNLNKVESCLNQLKIFDLNSQAAYQYAEIKARLTKTGKLIEDLDLQIASICLVNQTTLITNNLKHFSRITGLQSMSWV